MNVTELEFWLLNNKEVIWDNLLLDVSVLFVDSMMCIQIKLIRILPTAGMMETITLFFWIIKWNII